MTTTNSPILSGNTHVVAEILRSRWLLASLAVWWIVSSASAAKVQPLFESDQIIALTLTGPLRKIAAGKKNEEQVYRPGTLAYTNAKGEAITLDVELKARGNYRRKGCRHPPLRLRFDKSQTGGTYFDGQRRLKLVAPCKGGERYEQYVVQEYLVYRMYSLLGEHGFRVRPLQVRFVDAKGKERNSFAFFIEDEKRMAARYERKVAAWKEVSFDSFERSALARFELFQFMIGGHDWSVIAGPQGSLCCHNAKLLSQEDRRENVIPVPYDFDFTGIVNTRYALPPESIPIKRVRQRYYRGRCTTPAVVSATLEQFRAQREAIERLYEEYEYLESETRAKTLEYIDAFYTIIDDPKSLQKTVTGRCRG